MSQVARATPLPPPLLSWGLYSTVNLPKFKTTFSVRRSSPPDPPVETDATMTSSSVTFRYSSGASPPAFRTVSFASFRCLPCSQADMSSGVALSIYFVNDRSCTLTFPDPPPPPWCADPDWVNPQLHARTSIASLFVPSPDSPLIPSIVKNMSIAIDRLLYFSHHVSRCDYFPPLADGSLETRRRDTVNPSS